MSVELKPHNQEAYRLYDEIKNRLEKSAVNLPNVLKQHLPNTLKLMFAINMLNEGFHLPDIDGVIMMRPTMSPTIYQQQI